MRQPKFDPNKPCAWCNPCPSSHCDCGECTNKECKICYPPETETLDAKEDSKFDKASICSEE